MNQQKPSLLTYFNLHPQDAYRHVQYLTNTLENFVNAFKERIQVEIDYSKSLSKVGKKLQKFINSGEPTPLSYISSAFKVQHQQRSRHSLELAEYLHTEIQIPCQQILKQHQNELKGIEKQIKKLYKQGESVEQSYQRCLKKYYKSKQDWEQHMIVKSIINFYPNVTLAQKEKVVSKLQENKQQSDQHYQKYIKSLEVFNLFAQRYNNTISIFLNQLETLELEGILSQSDSIRKLILSQVNMFKNIQYDLLNISRQMEDINPKSQIQSFVINNKDKFQSPIISIYAQGPIIPNRYQIIDYKIPIKGKLLEQTLLAINNSLFTWQLQNKSNSTLRYAVQRLLKLYEQNDEGDNDFLEEFQYTINNNKTVKQIPIDDPERQVYLNLQEVYSHSLQIVSGIAQFLKTEQHEQQNKIKSLMQLFETYLSQHHFYRFIAFLTLDQYQDLHDQLIIEKKISELYAILIRLLIDKSIKAKDIFITRLILPLLFSVKYTQQKHYFQHALLQNLQIWSDRDFWQSAIFQQTYESITLLSSSPQRMQLKDVYLMRQKNVIFNGLLPFCHYMIMLGQQVSQTKSIMGRMCQIYNLYQKQQKDIFNHINQTYAEYRNMEE